MSYEQRLDAYDRQSLAVIDEHGWMIQGVFDNDGGPGFAYTVGLTPAGLPELVMSGLDHNTMATLLNAAAKRSLSEEVKVGDLLDGIASVGLRVVGAPGAEVNMARHLYGGSTVQALQLVWPDKAGAYPGDDDWSLGGLQPIFA